MHCSPWFPQLPICSWPMPQYIMQIELSPTSQYLFTYLIIPLNWSLDVHNCFASNCFLIIMTIVDLRLFPTFYYFFNQFLFMSQHSKIFNYIFVNNSTSCLNNSIFFLSRYLSDNILYILRHYQYSNISTLIITISTVFTVWISIFNN